MSPSAPARTWDPLTEVVLRDTTPELADPIASRPVAAARARPGTALVRSRAAILQGARAAVAHYGVRITMAQVAAEAGVAKATLYNHFRDRDAVLAALLAEEIDVVIRRCAQQPLAAALELAATMVGANPLLDALAAQSPAALLRLARIDIALPGWRSAAEAVEQLLMRDGLCGTPSVLRWLASLLVCPGDSTDIREDVMVLLGGFPPRAGRQLEPRT